jgi:hypothetical protein
MAVDTDTAMTYSPSSFTTMLGGQREPYVSARAKSRAAALKAELETIRSLDGVIEAIIIARLKTPDVFSEFKKEILAAINDDVSSYHLTEKSASTPPTATGDEETGVERLVAFFQARKNEPASVEQMADAIGLSKITVKAIVYRRHAKRFERIKERGKNNMAFFRLQEA